MEVRFDDLRNMTSIIHEKLKQLYKLESEIEILSRAALPRHSDAVLVERNGERKNVKIGDVMDSKVYVHDDVGNCFCVDPDRLILIDKITGEQ